MDLILSRNWNNKTTSGITMCHHALRKLQKDPQRMERTDSETFPWSLMEITQWSDRDLHWMWALAGSARVTTISAPEWSELNYDPLHVYDPQSDSQLKIALSFRFGFPLETITHAVWCGLARTGISWLVCCIIAEFVGNSRFLCSIETCFLPSKKRWWIQDGSLRIRHLHRVNSKYV